MDIDNTQDTLDSRDIIEKIDELQGERETIMDELNELKKELEKAMSGDETKKIKDNITEREVELKEWDELEGDDLKALKDLAEQCEGYSDWEHGEQLIRDSYFKEYAQELAEDIGAIDKDAQWPNTCIDWDEATEQLQQDYMCVDFDEVEYWIRI